MLKGVLHVSSLYLNLLATVGCTPSEEDAPGFYNMSRRLNVRRIYYAMIAEFDAMVTIRM